MAAKEERLSVQKAVFGQGEGKPCPDILFAQKEAGMPETEWNVVFATYKNHFNTYNDNRWKREEPPGYAGLPGPFKDRGWLLTGCIVLF